MAPTPFKFLDSYTRDDRDIFFGREKEIEELYYKILDGSLLVVFGSSGTGKTSLIQCGLAGKFQDADWMPVTVRRAENINESLKKTLQNLAVVPLVETNSLTQNIKSVYLDHFKPIYLLFDQFEELFIFGSDDELEEFIGDLQAALNSGLSCKFIFVIRGEYLENITRFEEKIPDFFNNRIRIERMTIKNAMRVITEPCRLFNIRVEEVFAAKVLERLGSDKATVELTYLQVYLDKLYKKASTLNPQHPVFDEELLQLSGEIDDVLAEFLDEQIAKTKNPADALAILKSFVSGEGTKKQMSVNETIEFTRALGKNLSKENVETDLRQFVDLRILKDKDDNGKFELRHDALAAKIYEQISSVEKEMLEVREFLNNRFNDFHKRSILLGDADLQYLSPYEHRLFLNEEQKLFIEKSKRFMVKKRNRRRNVALIAAAALIIVLSGFTLFSIKQRNEAVAQSGIAEQKSKEAIRQKELAEKAQQQALESSKQALFEKSFAEQQAKFADIQKKNAEQQARNAKQQSEYAMVQQQIAIKQEQVAEQKSREAIIQKQKADSAQSEANRLRRLALSQTVAFKSLQAKDDKQLSALLAYESYQLTAGNGGNTQDPELYSALYESLKNANAAFRSRIIQCGTEIKSIGISDQNIMALGSDGSLNAYAVADLLLRKTEHISGSNSALNTAYISPNGKFVITAYEDNNIIFYNAGSNTTSPPLTGHSGLIRAAAFSYNGNIFATGGRDSSIIVWSNNSMKQKIHFDSRIKALCMSDDPNTLAAGGEDGRIYLVNISSADKKSIAINSPARIQCSAYSRQGNFLASGSSNGIIQVFNKKGSLIKTITDNTGSVDFISVDEKLNVLISVSGSKIIHIYTLSDLSLKPIIIKDINRPIVSLALSPDGKIYVACADNAIRFYDVKTEQLSQLLLSSITRNFTDEEWKNYIGSDEPYQKIKPELP